MDGNSTAHSFTRTTVHPVRRRPLLTRRSRRRFCSILLRQKSVFVCGMFLQRLHPCQKHPSTKTATFRRGHAKSGRPTTCQCLRYPRRPDSQRRWPNVSSVLLFPFERIAAMMLDRLSGENRSIPSLQTTPILPHYECVQSPTMEFTCRVGRCPGSIPSNSNMHLRVRHAVQIPANASRSTIKSYEGRLALNSKA